jgi:hypothetical protein
MVGAAGSAQTIKVTTTKFNFDASTGQLNATIYNTLSDLAKKENIKTLENSLEKILLMRGVSFEWKDNHNKSIGVIAQEIEKVVPEIVNTNSQGIKSVSYDSIIGLLIEAIKEQQKQINIIKGFLK